MSKQPRPDLDPPVFGSGREAAAAQQRTFREMGPSGRLAFAIEFSEATIEAIRHALERLRPGATKRDIDIAFVEFCYGATLAREFAAHLESRAPLEAP